MLLILRIIASLLWNYQIVSIIINLLAVCLSIYYLYKYKISKPLFYVYSVLIVFIAILIRSLLIELNDDSQVYFIKIFFSFFIFIIGANVKNVFKDSITIAKISAVMIFVFTASAVMGVGFQYWGAIKTYSGPYYYKTDLALSVVISLSYILFFLNIKKYYKLALTICCLYLIFIANARIHILTSFIIIFLYFFQTQFLSRAKRTVFLLIPGAFAIFVLIAISMSSILVKLNLLTIDFTDFYSDSNLQGRNHIWDLLIQKFSEADPISKWFGMGLTADTHISKAFTDTGYVNNAHSGYLYTLISWGYIGSLSFITFFILTLTRFFRLADLYAKTENGKLLLMFISHIMIFYIASFSNISIIFQQQTWFFMFFSGLLYNRNYFSAKQNISNINTTPDPNSSVEVTNRLIIV